MAQKSKHFIGLIRYRVQNLPLEIFQTGSVLWSEPEGEPRQDVTVVTPYTLGETKYGQKVHSTIRRFVIVAADRGHCQCLPILTYQRQGATKYGINRDDHAIIYIGKPPPDEVSAEERLTKTPIQMIPKSPRDKLEPKSRINYAKIYTVEHNVKVFFIGRIASTSEKQFAVDFDDTWNKKRQLGGNW
ncbi:hypothetical protein D0Z07_7159 [Hyphodiscus hymeniophilus]|uniref:DUF6590 domain-containing protein n=1 Tax=Hyphodiscus hymeniophilus TaxID=353542 RepID=A0A9P6VG76_9HELO|nr:hypothetical protein D0Z07_7159 [Hyphodiscus hymeniophilus]